MRTLEIAGKGEFSIPSDWDELTVLQVNQILKLALKLIVNQLNYDEFIVKSFYIIAGIKRNWLSVYAEKRFNKKQLESKNANLYLCAEAYTDFLFKKPVKNKDGELQPMEFYYNTVVNNYPIIHAAGCKFIGPKTYLVDLTFGEFRKAIDAMNIYAKAKDEESLNDFVVLLYRPGRMALKDADLVSLSKKAAKIPLHIKTGVFLWFTTCVHYLTTSEVEINGRMLNFAMMFPKSDPNKKETGIGWTSLLFNIAKEGVFGDSDKTDERDLYDVLLYMYDNHLQNLKTKNKKA